MVVVILLTLITQVVHSAPSGIGKVANEGCLCHGEKNTNTIVDLQGLPQSFESNISYNFSIQVSSQTITENTEGEIGGFRLMVSGGTIQFNETQGLIQELDDGWDSHRIW